MRIIGQRVQVRTPEQNDDYDLFEIYSNQKVGNLAGWKAHQNIQITRNVLMGFIFNNETFVIELLETKKVIGTISLYKDTFRYKVSAADIGFSLNQRYVGYGFMHEALMLILDYAFKNLKFDVVGCSHIIGNERSKNTILSAGFVFEGLVRKYRRLYDGSIIDAAIYSITSEEFNNLKGSK